MVAWGEKGGLENSETDSVYNKKKLMSKVKAQLAPLLFPLK